MKKSLIRVQNSRMANRLPARAAKAICRECQVRGDCLEFALRSGEKFGIWGGLSERERRRVRRERQVTPARRAS